MLAEMMAEPEQSERPADIFGAARRSDRARRGAERAQEIRNARHRVEPFHIARPRARPVRLAKIGRKRPPVSRLDPPLRLLPIMAIIVAQTHVTGSGLDRMSVVWGKSVSVRVDHGGR